MSHQPMSIHQAQVDAYRAAGFTVNYPRDIIHDIVKAEDEPSHPWSEPDADPGKDMREAWEKSRQAYLSS